MNPEWWQIAHMRTLSDLEREKKERQRNASRASQPRRKDTRKAHRR